MKRLKFFTFLFLSISILFLACQAKAAVPSSITDLRCVLSGASGSVWLLWTVPSGSPTSYDVRYSQGVIDASTFNAAWQYSQSWSGSVNQGLVEALAQGNYWFFAIKSINASGASGVSNAAYCYVPQKSSVSNIVAPTSLITYPANGDILQYGKDYIIKGTSSGTSSSVKQVEISFDGGDTWKIVSPKSSVVNGFTWEYAWSKPVVGLYLIKTRATDWSGNIEIGNAGISAQVVSDNSSFQISTSTQEIATSSLNAKIVAIQQQIIQLILQLINLLKSGM
jgi:hypothetical protein